MTSRPGAKPIARPPRQQRSQKSLERIIAAGEAVLRRDGLENFVMQTVAQRAGVSIGGIYGRFRDKEELLFAIQSEVLTRLETQIERSLKRRDITSLSDAVSTLITALDNHVTENGSVFAHNQNLTDGDPLYARIVSARAHILEAFAACAMTFRREIAHPEPAIAFSMALQLILATVALRARAGQSPHRPPSMDRGVALRELNRAVITYLTCEHMA